MLRLIPEKEVSKGGLVHIKYHLTSPRKIPYIYDNTLKKIEYKNNGIKINQNNEFKWIF